jgi:hypothetical protein
MVEKDEGTRSMAKTGVAAAGAVWALLVLAAGASSARQLPEDLNEGADTTGTITDRDNTRVGGIAYDSSGKPLPDVDIWVANDASPSQRMRTRSRKTGGYLARGLGPLYTEHDIYGVVLRLTFELPGHRMVESKVAVEKNELGTLHPILFREGEEPPSGGDRMAVALSGLVTGKNGKPARGAAVRVSVAEDPSFAAETVTAKDGRYEVLLWNVPTKVQLEVSANPDSLRREVVFDPPQRRDQVVLASLDLDLGAP